MSESGVVQTPISNRENNPTASILALMENQPLFVLSLFGITGCFFLPWFTYEQTMSAATLFRVAGFYALLWLVPVCALATFFLCRANKAIYGVVGTATAIIAGLGVASVALRTGHGFGEPTLRWGASLTAWFALFLFVASGKQRITAPIDFVAQKLSSRNASVYSHWGSLTPGIHFSTKEFYAKLEQAIAAREWPGVEVLRIDYNELGILSHKHGLFHKREYLRIIRQRQVFDLCASTFGHDYFFSIREAEIPAIVTIRVIFAALVIFFALLIWTVHTFGLIFGSSAFLLFGAFTVCLMYNIARMGMTRLDSFLLRAPIIGPVYEAYFRRETYFQQDTRIVFLQSVNELAKQHVEETVSAKGIRFLDSFERQPILDQLYRRSRTTLPQPQPPPA